MLWLILLGAIYDIHHGLANAILLPYVMVANRDAIAERMVLPGRILNLQTPDFEGMLAWVLRFREELGIPDTLSAAGIPGDYASEIGRRAAVDPCAAGNPVTFSAGRYEQIFLNALWGKY